MKFRFTFANGETEITEMQDCSTVEAALNSRVGSANGVRCEPYPPPLSLWRRIEAKLHPEDYQPPRVR